jgi:hypothetical protein
VEVYFIGVAHGQKGAAVGGDRSWKGYCERVKSNTAIGVSKWKSKIEPNHEKISREQGNLTMPLWCHQPRPNDPVEGKRDKIDPKNNEPDLRSDAQTPNAWREW